MCGALWIDDRSAHELLRGVTDALAPFGRPATWSGTLGPWNAALCAITPHAIRPTITPSGAVVYADVTLYGRRDLRDRLNADQQATDVELIGLAYDRWGRDMFQHLNGDFAVAVVDPSRSGLLLGRDHAGHRFLAVHERPGAVAFSSTTLSLTGFPGVGHDLDVERLAELAIAAYGPTRTFLRGVDSIAPGWWRWIGPDERRDHQWWQPGTNPDQRLGFGGGAREQHFAKRSKQRSPDSSTR